MVEEAPSLLILFLNFLYDVAIAKTCAETWLVPSFRSDEMLLYVRKLD